MMLIRRTRTLSIALLAALSACDGSTDPDVDLAAGRFQVRVSGDTTFTLAGEAFYGSPQMFLTDQGNDGREDADFIQLFVQAPADPRERRYDDLMIGGSTLFVVRGGAIVRQFLSTSGSMEIDEVTAATVAGTVRLTANEWSMAGQEIPGSTITIRADFNATRDTRP